MPLPTRTVLLLGGNIDDPPVMLDAATERIAARIGPVLARSRSHWTQAWSMNDAPDFLNIALLVETTMPAREVLDACLSIERDLGRERMAGAGYRSRAIDIDLLFHGDQVINTPGITIPHPRLHERYFALAPAADIVPQSVHPGLGLRVMDLLSAVIEKEKSPRTA